MKLKYLFVALALLLNIKVFAQAGRDVKGVVKDTAGVTLPGTTLKMITATDSSAIITDANGAFIFHNVTVKEFSLVVLSMGYQPIKRRFTLDDKTTPFTLLPIVLKSDTRMLGVVTVTDVNAVKLKEDTVEYNAAAYKVRDGAPVEDMIKKMPGLDVDKDGNVTAQGKSVTKIRVNGKDFFGGDVKTATRNLPADIIQSIQVVDDYGDQANITGVKTGEPDKILNINIKPSKNYGYFGQASVGGGQDMLPNGTENGRYVAQGNLFRFDGDRQLAVLGNLNNTNTNLFSFGGPPGGGGGGGPRGGPGGNANSGNGITTARSIGFNYRDSWSKKTTVYGSYSFANNTVNTTSTTIQNNISIDNPSTNNQSSIQETSNLNHRFNFNIEYKPDTVNYLKITPSFAFAAITTDQTAANQLMNATQIISDYTFSSYLHSTAPNYGGNVLYNHRFAKKGRNFSLNVGAGSYNIDQYQNPIYVYTPGTRQNAPANQLINTASRTDSVGVNVSYLEPLAKKSYLEFTYGYKYQNTTADRNTDTLTDAGVRNNYALLTNNYEYNFTTNRFGLNFRFIDKKYNYTLGVVAQPSVLEGSSPGFAVNRKEQFNVAPTARFIYNFSRSQSLSINYNGTSQQPTYTQLQPVTDYSTASYPVKGNPDLKPEFNNVLSIRYNKFDFASGNVFFSNLSFTQSNNKIVSTTINYPVNASDPNLAGSILTTYQNADGYYAANAFYVFAKPWAKRKYNLFFQGNANYNNNISYIGGFGTDGLSLEKNIAKNLVLSQGVRFRVNITDIIDAEANTTYAVNRTTNTLSAANVNTKFSTLTLGLNGKNYFFKDWTLSYDFSKQIYYGYTGSTNPNILNTYVERRFLKGNVGTLRFAVNDVFNQNTGYTTTSSGSYITQTNANKLGRYFLLTFTLRLQKFAGARPSGPGGPGGPGMGGPGMGGPPPF